MEIQVGEFIRTKDGIKKIVKINEGKLSTYYGKYIVFPEYKNSKSINVKNIIKHSFNIIDLIEEGDILKIKDVPYAAEYISEVFEDYENNLCVSDFEVEELRPIRKYVDENKIKIIAILTKEQFKAMEYEVK